MTRRLIDLVGAGLGLMLLSPVLLAAALVVRWQSPGPVFFRHRRVGLNGEELEVLKLRTMLVGSERRRGLTGRDDPRITPVGRILRRWKVDEIPQLVNVLRGEMSLVGPRPEVPAIVARYSEAEREVLSVRPGITGPSQILWRREEECYPPGVDTEAYYLTEILPRKLRTDLEYVRTRSLAGDLGYLWKTLFALWSRGPRMPSASPDPPGTARGRAGA